MLVIRDIFSEWCFRIVHNEEQDCCNAQAIHFLQILSSGPRMHRFRVDYNSQYIIHVSRLYFLTLPERP